jgi:RNA polymerase sigma factor (sigma-70 family)
MLAPSISDSLAEAVRSAGEGDQAAWDALVERFGGLVWATVRSFGLNSQDSADAAQTTWLRLVEHLGDVRNPRALPAWLQTTARREALAALRRAGRHDVLGDELERLESPEPAPGVVLLAAERGDALRRALLALPPRQRELMLLLAAEPRQSYAEIGARLGMPVGSIGPTRARCLDRLRRHLGG